MVFIADAVGVGEVGMGEPQRRRLGVHGVHAVRNGAAAEVFGQEVGAVVGAGHHGAVQRIGKRHFLALLQGNVAGIRARQRVNVLVGDGELDAVPGPLCLLAGKAQRHHLGDGGRVERFVHILLGQHKAGVCVDDAVGLGSRQGRARRLCRQQHRTDPKQHRTKCGDLFFHVVYSNYRY